jgi:hypothetical protein
MGPFPLYLSRGVAHLAAPASFVGNRRGLLPHRVVDSWRTIHGDDGGHQHVALMPRRLTNVAADKHFSDAASPQ